MTTSEKMKPKMANSDLLTIMAENVADTIRHKMTDLGMDREKAITETKKETTAGWKAWEMALDSLA